MSKSGHKKTEIMEYQMKYYHENINGESQRPQFIQILYGFLTVKPQDIESST